MKNQNQNQKKIPEVKTVDIGLIKLDPKNPNEVSKAEMKALRASYMKFGQVKPIVVDQNWVIADGHHRLEVCKELGYNKVQVIQVNVSVDERRILGRVLNKLHGKDNKDASKQQYETLVSIASNKALLEELIPKGSDNVLDALLQERTVDVSAGLPGPGSKQEIKQERMITCPKCKNKFPIEKKKQP